MTAFLNCPPTSPELLRLIERAKANLAAMTPEQREAHFAEQKRRWVKAEMEWDEDATVQVRPS